MKRKLRRSEEMFPVVEKQLRSGKSQEKFCQSIGLSKSVLSYWLKKYRAVQDYPSHDGFEVLEIVSGKERSIVIRYPNGTEVRIPFL